MVLDGTAIISICLEGRALEIYKRLRRRDIPLSTTDRLLHRVNHHFPRIASKKGLMVGKLVQALDLIGSDLKIYSEDFFKTHLPEAHERIGHRDVKDASLLALTMELDVPIWTNDDDFQIPKVKEAVTVYTTSDLLKKLYSE